MQTLAKDDSPGMSAPRAAPLKGLEEVASKEWLAMLRVSSVKHEEAIKEHRRHARCFDLLNGMATTFLA